VIEDTLGGILPDLADFLATPNSFSSIRRLILAHAFMGNFDGIGDVGKDADEIIRSIEASLQDEKAKSNYSSLLFPLDDTPYDLPKGWRWVRLSAVCTHIVDCLHRTPTYSSSGYPAIRTNDIVPGKLLLETARRVSEEEYIRQTQRLAPRAGDIFYSREGNYGMAAVVPEDVKICLSQRMMQFRLHQDIDPAYFAWALNSPVMFDQAKRSVLGTTVPHINIRALRNFAFPLAPSSAQQAIVGWINRAMSLTDHLESAYLEQQEQRHLLARSALFHLSFNGDDFALGHLDELIQSLDDIQELERTVHELAVRGRLTRSHPGDGSVLDYLDRVRSSVLDTPDLLDVRGKAISASYELPEGWRWVTLGALLTAIRAGWSPSAQVQPKEGDEWGVLKVSACSWGEFRPEENKALFPGESPRRELEVRPGDFLISRANTSDLVGRSVVVEEAPVHLMLSDKTLRLSTAPGCNVKYLNLANLARTARLHYEREATGTSSSMRNVSQLAIRRTPIPLPPPAEQDRIVTAVDQLKDILYKLRVAMQH
jgi:type I restriction enzyme S subunit